MSIVVITVSVKIVLIYIYHKKNKLMKYNNTYKT